MNNYPSADIYTAPVARALTSMVHFQGLEPWAR